MSDSLGITGINGLGSLGLGGSSMYTDPYAMMGMNSYAMGSMSPYMMGGMAGMSPYGMGMMGMYNPAFMGQMNQVYQDIEKSNLQHTGAMHQLKTQTETQASIDDDNALFEQLSRQESVQKCLRNLNNAIVKGNTDDACKKYDELKNLLINRYGDIFKRNPGEDVTSAVTGRIEGLYSSYFSKLRNGQPASLRDDINTYCDSSFAHGFWQNFKGKGYYKKDAEECANYILGDPLSDKAGRERAKKLGKWTESGLEGAAAIGIGYGGAMLGAGLLKFLNPANAAKGISLKGAHKFGKWAGLGLLATDILWQISR